MAIEIVGNLPPQYLDLLKKSAQEIGLTPHDISLALKSLVEANPEPENLAKCLQLFKAIAVEKFPFIVLVSGDEQKRIKSASLIPDPQIVKITHKGEEIFHVFSRHEDFETANTPDIQLANVIKEKIKGHLYNCPQRPDMKPDTVAIARTKNTWPPDPKHSLSFGFPYLAEIRQIQMGLIKAKRGK